MADDQLPEKRYLRIDVRGKDPALWQQLRSKLITAIGDLLDRVVDAERGSTLREEAQKMTSALLDHAKARLARAGVENEKLEAEVKRLYAQCEGFLLGKRYLLHDRDTKYTQAFDALMKDSANMATTDSVG